MRFNSGPRDLGFESRHSDHKKHLPRQVLFSFHPPFGPGCAYTLYTLYTRIFGSVPNENDSLRRFCPPNWNLASQNLPPKGNVINLSTEVPSTTVIARSAATWQSVFSLVTGAKSGRCKGNGLPRQCAHWLAMTYVLLGRENPGSGIAAGDFH